MTKQDRVALAEIVIALADALTLDVVTDRPWSHTHFTVDDVIAKLKILIE